MGRHFRGPDKDATITRKHFLLDEARRELEDARREIAALRVELAHKDEEHAAALKRIHAEATALADTAREHLTESNGYIAKLEGVLRKHGIIQ